MQTPNVVLIFEFERGATEQDRHLGDPTNTPNPCLAPLGDGPYYAVELTAGVLGTAGGLSTNTNGQVVDWRGVAIPGPVCGGQLFGGLVQRR